MSVKDLFDKGHSLKFIRKKNQGELREDVESSRYIEAYVEKRDRFFPNVDFLTASNFARFGSAELYYDTSIKRIYQTYPYDGSLAEKIEWENESTYLDAFIFEKEYPRSTGFITLNSGSADGTYTATKSGAIYSSSAPQYIYFSGGPNADASGDYKNALIAGPSQEGASKANIYNTASQRTNNLELDAIKGWTVEFWMKKDKWASESTQKNEYFFNVYSYGGVVGNNYGSWLVYSDGKNSADKLNLLRISGSSVASHVCDTGLNNIADGQWHHYAITNKRSGADDILKLYVDGNLADTKMVTDADERIGAIAGKLVASIGALAGPVNSSGARGWGNVVDTSFDEFRFWKTERNAQEIGRNFREQVGGGTNTDNVKYDKDFNPVDLGVYYKFNEGITGKKDTDSAVLDYSGRVSNGEFINYDSSNGRNTGSAFVISGVSPSEFKDPILYSFHPDVSAYSAAKLTSGSFWDEENSSMLLKMLPGWLVEEDEKKSDNLKYLIQIISSFFDDIFLQMEALPRLKDINYPYDNDHEKPLAFADRLLSHRGIDVPELFADATILAKYLNRDEHRLFEKKLYDIKNTIYQNIYNNLTYIQKTKGTLKSIRNFLRCFGVDEELVKVNIYANNDTYELKDNYTYSSLKKKFIDFDDLETRYEKTGEYTNSFTATTYQYYDSTNTDSLSYIPSISRTLASGSAATMEVEVVFPRREIKDDDNYNLFPGRQSCIFGVHAVKESNTDLSYLDGTGTDPGTDDINFRLLVEKSINDKRDGKFVLSTGHPDVYPEITSDTYQRLYDNEKWNFAIRIRPKKLYGGMVTGSFEPKDSSYLLELYGVNYLSNILQEEVALSASISFDSALKFFAKPKRIFAGAERTNFTGSVVNHSDVKVSSVRYWHDYLTNDTVKAHARDSSIYGAYNPYRNDNFLSHDSDQKIAQIDKLVLDWAVDKVTTSDNAGEFFINDFSSGSLEHAKNRFGSLSTLLGSFYPGKGDFFVTGSDQAVDVEFLPTGKQRLPELVNSDDMIKTLSKFDDWTFNKDTTYIQHHFSIEKSMYQTISEEMLRFFATIVDFNNLIGEPVNRYRPNYKKIDKLRDLFFEKVQEDPDLDKFVEYYKWIDDAVSMMIFQLIPASSNKVDLLRNMVESHILERNKYWTKFPTLEGKTREPFDPILGINEMLYNWKFGHPNPGTTESDSCLWWKDRAERNVRFIDSANTANSQTLISSSVHGVNDNKNTLLRRITTNSPILASNMRPANDPILKTEDGATYESSTYVRRALTRPVRIDKDRVLNLKGGSNSKVNKKYNLYKGVIKWGSDDDYLFMDLDDQLPKKDCDDVYTPPELKKEIAYFKSTIETANDLADTIYGGLDARAEYDDLKSEQLFPFSIYTSSIDNGYKKAGYINALGTKAQFRVDFNNYHHDYYGPNAEIPMQGPFTETNVGGMQHRHADINHYSLLKGNYNNLDSALDRVEGWALHNNLTAPLAESDFYLQENFAEATFEGHQNHTLLRGPSGDQAGGMYGNEYIEPSPYEYWAGGTDCGARHAWTFKKGSTPSYGTGPNVASTLSPGGNDKFAYCEVLPEYSQQDFGLRTPIIDFRDLSTDSGEIFLGFRYHMYGVNMGTLRVQSSTDPTFATDVRDISINWDTGGSAVLSTALTGEQQANEGDAFKYGVATANKPAYGNGLQGLLGKRFYLRFFYTAGIGHLGDCAIDSIQIYQAANAAEYKGDSWRVLHPTHDSVRQPHGMLFRDEVAKRPLNIKNIEITSSSPTKAGNYHHRYQYLNTSGRSANDPWFVKNHTEVSNRTSSMGPLATIGTGSSITSLLTARIDSDTTGVPTATSGSDEFSLPDRSYLSGTIRNKTRFVSRFSSPGDHESLSRGYLDREHETFSVYNAMPWRNRFVRQRYTSQLQAHMGKFGVSTHTAASAATLANAIDVNGAPGTGEFLTINVPTEAGGVGSVRLFFVDLVHVNMRPGVLAGTTVDDICINKGGGASVENLRDRIKAAIDGTTDANVAPGTGLPGGQDNGHFNSAMTFGAGKGLTSAAVDTDKITLTHTAGGTIGNNVELTKDTTQIVFPNATDTQNLTGGVDPTGRVLGTETVGSIRSEDYSISGDAAVHKHHPNSMQRIQHNAESLLEGTFITGTVHDNGFVSHMIPRTDFQYAWITASII